MPVTVSYPGVYLEEIPSGVRAITGVATAVAAFVGRTLRGPEAEATRLFSWSEFERQFGGLWRDSTLSYAVSHYFANGGSDAVIVRVSNGAAAASVAEEISAGTTAVAATLGLAMSGGGTFALTAQAVGDAGNSLSATVEAGTGTAVWVLTLTDGVTPETYTFGPDDIAVLDDVITAINAGALASAVAGTLTADLSVAPTAPFTGGADAVAGPSTTFSASSGGTWGNNLRVTVDYATKDASDTDLFNLTVSEVDPDDTSSVVRSETFRNLSIDPSDSRFAESVVNDESTLVNIDLSGAGGARPAAATSTLAGGTEGSALTSTEVIAGIPALETAEIFTMLCLPPPAPDEAFDATGLAAAALVAVPLCDRRNAVWIVDAPPDWDSYADAVTGMASLGINERNAALFFPWLKIPDSLRENRLASFAPSGVVAGIFARNDGARGVWKAPAGLEANARGVRELTVKLTDAQQGTLNQVGLNCFRTFPNVGTVVWGSRTLRGADVFSDDYKYLPVRRLANYLRESLYRGTQWAVFEPNDDPLWSQLRLTIGSFMQSLFQQGAFAGQTPRQAYFVKCDRETTTQTDINLGIVNILVGFAPLKPAEFVIIKLQQMAGQGG